MSTGIFRFPIKLIMNGWGTLLLFLNQQNQIIKGARVGIKCLTFLFNSDWRDKAAPAS
jgi:hypothetical protein